MLQGRTAAAFSLVRDNFFCIRDQGPAVNEIGPQIDRHGHAVGSKQSPDARSSIVEPVANKIGPGSRIRN